MLVSKWASQESSSGYVGTRLVTTMHVWLVNRALFFSWVLLEHYCIFCISALCATIKQNLLDLLKLRFYNPEDYNFLDLMYPRKNKSCCWRSCFDLSNFIWVENMFWDMHYETTLTLVVLRHDTCMRFASPTLMASRDLLNTLLFLQMYCSLNTFCFFSLQKKKKMAQHQNCWRYDEEEDEKLTPPLFIVFWYKLGGNKKLWVLRRELKQSNSIKNYTFCQQNYYRDQYKKKKKKKRIERNPN